MTTGTQIHFFFETHGGKIPGNVRRGNTKVHRQSSKRKYKTTKSENYYMAECLDVKRLLQMQTSVFFFQTVTKSRSLVRYRKFLSFYYKQVIA